MEILYISSVPSKKEFFRIKGKVRDNVNVTTYGMNESGFKFHTLILEGLSQYPNSHILSLVGRSVSIKSHQGLFWKSSRESLNENLTIKHLSFVNFPFLKQLILGIAFFNNTLSWLYKVKNSSEKYIIMDASYITAIPFIIAASSIFKCKKAAIFCDIYEYMGNVKDARDDSKLFHKIIRKIVSHFYSKLDGFILLTEAMNPVVNGLRKPYIIVEGLVDINMKDRNISILEKNDKHIIMYAGAIRKQYGLENLVKGFMDYQDDMAELWIFGDGDYSVEIQKASKKDSRIHYGGVLTNEEIVEKEMKATLLINPRPIDQEFTKYSFPSKNMEYMVSGTPVLTTKLPGMPKEYYNYIYTIRGNSPKDVTNSITEIFKNTSSELYEKGLAAKEFVINNKNNIAQATKIVSLLKKMREK